MGAILDVLYLIPLPIVHLHFDVYSMRIDFEFLCTKPPLYETHKCNNTKLRSYLSTVLARRMLDEKNNFDNFGKRKQFGSSSFFMFITPNIKQAT